MGVAVGEHQPLRRAYGGGTQKRKGGEVGYVPASQKEFPTDWDELGVHGQTFFGAAVTT